MTDVVTFVLARLRCWWRGHDTLSVTYPDRTVDVWPCRDCDAPNDHMLSRNAIVRVRRW